MERAEVIQLAFEIISYAGDAMDCFYNAVLDYKSGNLEEAKKRLEEGNKALNKTHLIQTKLIQDEVNDQVIPSTLIMTHAQDHLTSAINWQRIVTLLLTDN
ncbi:PTS lactose/cellobiose transporter subunit IIA [Solobacterium moorei]|uniref:PTS lactose/cellobiose transporter subunit IIA n=1 Tax=Solobacterium moorei TaxID=102148 RepID=UPI000420AB1A|nr:PTS lactose/cellobiose transporter subunit IIA [Solobacterium moorei]BET22626.1 PTS lactose/cellobiose transporter subunit IIA [Solobacterium moorei]